MTEKNKKIIEQINSGIIPDGYKKTKVGIVPVEWEECKLSEFLNVNKDKNIDLKYNKEDVFSISGEYGVVNQMQFLGRSYAGESVAPYRIVYPFDIIYTKSPLKINPYGIIKSNQTNATGIVSTLYAVYHCKDNVLSKYIEYYFGLDSVLNNYLLPLVNIGSKHDMKISDENVLKGYVSFPPHPEQQKIAEILTTQDKLIELQERKIEQLKTLKKGYLQKMFPKKGCKYPELRFKGFTDPWEQRKLGEILKSSDEKNTDNIGYDRTISVSNMKWNPSGNGASINSLQSYKVLRLGDFAFEGNRTKGHPYGKLVINDIGDGIMSARFRTLRPISEICIPFWKFYLLNTDIFNHIFVQSTKRGTLMNELVVDDLLKQSIYIPSTIEEQHQIGTYFHNLDTLITLHQRKLDKEKQKKKALMQLLLTGKVRVST